MSTTRKFTDLPLDLQRTVIDNCIANRKLEMVVDEELIKLPHMIQITYRCNNPKCNEVISVRFFATTVVNSSVVPTRWCPKRCMKGATMYISHKTAVLDYYLGPKQKKSLRGLEKFFMNRIQEDKEQFGTVDDDELKSRE